MTERRVYKDKTIEHINERFHKAIMLPIYDLGRTSHCKDYEQFRYEVALICKSYLMQFYSVLKNKGAIEGDLKYEYDVQSFDKSKISKEDLLTLASNIYIYNPNSFLNRMDLFSKYAFNADKIIELGKNGIKEYEYLDNAESSFFNIRCQEIVDKTMLDLVKYCEELYKE